MGSLGSSEDQYLAKPSGACCLKGTLHEGKSRGTFIDVVGVDTYISEPPSDKANGHILLYFPDVWGMFPNGLLIMDGFADAGYLVLGLDYFRGVSHCPMPYCDILADSRDRIPYGSIGRTVTTTAIPTSTTKPGSGSTWLSQMRRCLRGLML
jgi:hypothetical protein